MYESHLVTDFKIALATIDEIIKENKNNPDVLDACQVTVKQIKKAIKGQNAVAAQVDSQLLENALFGLYRTRMSLWVLRDAELIDSAEPKVGDAFGILLDIVEEKISTLKDGKERGK